MCYKYAWSFPAAAATAEALRRCCVPRCCGEGVLGQALAAAAPGLPTQPLGRPLTPIRHSHRLGLPWACATENWFVSRGCCSRTGSPRAQTHAAEIKMDHGKYWGGHHPSRSRRSCHPPTPADGEASPEVPLFAPSAQRREQFFLLRLRSCFAGCCLLRCMEVAILMEISVAVPT